MSEHPKDLRYTSEHEWARVETHGEKKVATIGITEFAVEQLGDITQVDLPSEGEKVKKGDVFGTIESVKAVSDLFAPVTGKVLKVNSPASDSPETINEDCYDEGWLIQIEIEHHHELEELMSAAQYEEYLKEHG